jgi:hypothetical protein
MQTGTLKRSTMTMATFRAAPPEVVSPTGLPVTASSHPPPRPGILKTSSHQNQATSPPPQNQSTVFIQVCNDLMKQIYICKKNFGFLKRIFSVKCKFNNLNVDGYALSWSTITAKVLRSRLFKFV